MPVTVKFDPSSQTPQARIIGDATPTQAGVMSAADKIKLDSLSPGGGPPFTDTTFAVTDAVDPTRQVKFDVQGTTGTKTTLATSQTVDRVQTLPDFDGDIPVVQTGSRLFLLNMPAQDNGSNAGIQYRSDVANRGAARVCQYGANTGIPGFVTFKSRGAIGVNAPVAAGDTIGRLTAIGVTDNGSIPLSGLLSFVVAPGGVPAGQGYVATDFEVQNVALSGPSNGARKVFKVDSQGVPGLREDLYTGPQAPTTLGNTAMGVVLTDGTGTVVVANTNVTVNTRIALTIQDGGAVPTNGVYVSARVPGVGFTIKSISADVGVRVLYQLTQPIP